MLRVPIGAVRALRSTDSLNGLRDCAEISAARRDHTCGRKKGPLTGPVKGRKKQRTSAAGRSTHEPAEACGLRDHILLEPGRYGAAMSMVMSIWMILAGSMGAVGVVLVAASAHAERARRLDAAGYLLLLHAAAVVAVIAALDRGLVWWPLGVLAVSGYVLGSAVFAGDLTLRAFFGRRLFPMAAPSGGALLIAGWLLLAVAALAAMLKT
jgi:uncharacterized membrane protein YgdD (TMEM256/DUF423 family)